VCGVGDAGEAFKDAGFSGAILEVLVTGVE